MYKRQHHGQPHVAGQAGQLIHLYRPRDHRLAAGEVDAVRAAARGEGRWSASVASKLAAWTMRPPQVELPAKSGDLTEREIDVLRLLARGWDNHRIGKELHISERTVRFPVSYTHLDVYKRQRLS